MAPDYNCYKKRLVILHGNHGHPPNGAKTAALTDSFQGRNVSASVTVIGYSNILTGYSQNVSFFQDRPSVPSALEIF